MIRETPISHARAMMISAGKGARLTGVSHRRPPRRTALTGQN
jgi:hypothetical protein